MIAPMFNPTQIVIAAFIRELREMYDRTYGTLEPGFPGSDGPDQQKSFLGGQHRNPAARFAGSASTFYGIPRLTGSLCQTGVGSSVSG